MMSRSTGSPERRRSGPRDSRYWEPREGFTLVEVLVAFVILTSMMVLLLRLFSSGSELADESKKRILAALAAESRLAAVGTEIPLAVGKTSGPLEAGLSWLVEIRPYREASPAVEDFTLVEEEEPAFAFEVFVTVHWNGRNGRESITLASLRNAGLR